MVLVFDFGVLLYISLILTGIRNKQIETHNRDLRSLACDVNIRQVDTDSVILLRISRRRDVRTFVRIRCRRILPVGSSKWKIRKESIRRANCINHPLDRSTYITRCSSLEGLAVVWVCRPPPRCLDRARFSCAPRRRTTARMVRTAARRRAPSGTCALR